MGNVALQVERTLSGSVDPGANVIFELVTHSTGDIIYDDITGNITFMEAGRYVINWFVITQASSYGEDIVFAFSSPNGTSITGNSNLRKGEVVGIGIFDIATAPATFSLKNTGVGIYYYPDDIPVKASLVITRDDWVEPVDVRCFAIDQLIHILSQMITAYSTTTWTIYTESLYYYSGMPLELYKAPNADKPGLLRLIDTNDDYEALPLEHITAIYPGDGTVYDPGFTYLNAPDPIPQNCNSDLLSAVQSYLPVGTSPTLSLGPSIAASGDVYRSEYGMIVLSDNEGNTPIFIPPLNILRIFITGNPTNSESESKENNSRPEIKIIKQ